MEKLEFIYINNINELRKDSFREPELYREILSIESELDRQSKASEVRAAAKCMGEASTFDSMYKAAQIACPHPIYPTRILRNAETGKYKIELEFFVRGRLRRVIVPREVIASTSKILELANDSVQVTGKTAPYLVEYLSEVESLNPEIIREYLSTSRLGWINVTDENGDTERKFLPYQQEVVFDEPGVKTLYESIKAVGSRDKWYAIVKQIRARKRNEININLAASFASVLVEPCGALPFIVSLWGGTGIGKSVILKLCTSVWADPGEGKYITDAKATNTAVEIRLNILNSLPMTLDDMAQVKNQYDEDFSELIYRWCAGKGRDRSNRELGLNKLTSWRNCTITNGERSMVDESTQGGAVNRVIDIEAAGDTIFDGKSGNKTVSTIEKNYGYAGRDFISALEKIPIEDINAIVTKYYDQIKDIAAEDDLEKEDKQIMPMALILAADELIEEHLFQDGIRLDVRECAGYLKNKGEVDENERIYSYLMEKVQINIRNFEDSEDDDSVQYQRWGFLKDDNYVAIYSAVFDEILSGNGFQAKSFLAWAKKKDLLELDPTGRPRKNVSHGAIRGARAVVIKTDYGNETPIDSGFVTADIENLPFND